MSWVRTSIHWWWFNLHDSLVWSLKEWNAELLMPRKNQNYWKGSWQILRSNLWRFPALIHLLILGAYIQFLCSTIYLLYSLHHMPYDANALRFSFYDIFVLWIIFCCLLFECHFKMKHKRTVVLGADIEFFLVSGLQLIQVICITTLLTNWLIILWLDQLIFWMPLITFIFAVLVSEEWSGEEIIKFHISRSFFFG